MNALLGGLGIQGSVMDELIRHRSSGTEYVGVKVGSYHGHWAISGEVDLAFRAGSDLITFVPWVNLGADFDDLASGGSKVSLEELAEIQLNASTLAVLLSGAPAGRRKIPIRIGIPRQQRWLRMIDGLHQGAISHEDYLAYVELVSRSSLFAEDFFRDLLREMLGDGHGRVRVSAHDELLLAGRHLSTALGKDRVPSLDDLVGVMRHSANTVWTHALDPELREMAGLPGTIGTMDELILTAHAVTLAGAARDGLAIAVGFPDPTGDTLVLAQDLVRAITVDSGEPQRWLGALQVNPLHRTISTLLPRATAVAGLKIT
ncbi:hypothetical protein ACRYCC_13225 [Actinomadura scrupuli]|uniref:hypothetical protein n=1 Tax=Actinomadura scrupuli TaxID=559629 RepID=UPI003D99A4EF